MKKDLTMNPEAANLFQRDSRSIETGSERAQDIAA